jgi:hypothetical protein
VVGNWYSFCLTYNQTSSAYYLNGTGYSAALTNTLTASSGSGAIVIGAGITGPSGTVGYSNVSVADVQLYSVGLSASRVLGIYRSGMYAAPPNRTGLVGWWPLLGDGNDYSGAGQVGFPSNTAFIASNNLPGSLSGASQVGRYAIPLQLTNNGVSKIYNVSVVVWTN